MCDGLCFLLVQGSGEEAVQPSRRLLATALANQADVNYQFMASTTNNVAAVQAELANVIKNSTGGPSKVPVSHLLLRKMTVITFMNVEVKPSEN